MPDLSFHDFDRSQDVGFMGDLLNQFLGLVHVYKGPITTSNTCPKKPMPM